MPGAYVTSVFPPSNAAVIVIGVAGAVAAVVVVGGTGVGIAISIVVFNKRKGGN